MNLLIIRTIFLTLLTLSSSVVCSGETGEITEFKETVSKTSEYIKKAMKEHNITGLSIALVYDDKIVWKEGFGFADLDKKIHAAPDTVYMLGSGSKTFAAAAILQYMDKGIVSLDTPIKEYIRNFKMLDRFKDQSESITIRRLLNHHSGIPGDLYNNMAVEEVWSRWGSNLYIDWLLDYLKSDYPSYAPGEIAVYGNTGFILAGEIIKKMNNENDKTFCQVMELNLLKPLDMKSSSFTLTNGQRLAKGYINGHEAPPIQFNGVAGATGGLFTTVEDMSKFLIMLLNDGKIPGGAKILEPKTLSEMGESEVSPLDINSYFVPGLGFDSVHDSTLSYAGRTWMKDGSTGNFNSLMGLLPDKKLGVIILTNCDAADLIKYPIMRFCLKSALSEKFKLEPVLPRYPEWDSISDLAKIEGKYVYSSGYDEITKDEAGSLLWTKNALLGERVNKKLKFNGKRYSVEGSTEEIVFRDITGHILMIQYGSDGSEPDRCMYDSYVIKLIGEKEKACGIKNNCLKTWKNRVWKKYLINNMAWNNLSWSDDPTFSLTEKNGSFIVKISGEHQLLLPVNENLAFVQGLNNRGDSSIRFSSDKTTGVETASYSSYTGFDIDKIPVISGEVTINNIGNSFPETIWYKYDAVNSGEEIHFSIDNSLRKYKIRLFDKNLNLLQEGFEEMTWKSEKGEWFVAISPLPGDGFSFTLRVTSREI